MNNHYVMFSMRHQHQTKQQRRWRRLGHVLCMDRNSLPHVALKWTPFVKGETDHWRTVEEEMKMRPESNLADSPKTMPAGEIYWCLMSE